MTNNAPLVSRLRSRPGAIRIGEGAQVVSVRVQVPEVWDVVRVEAAADVSVAEVKRRSLEVLVSDAIPDDYVVKLRGFEVLDESESLEAVGAKDGSTFLVSFRRRRPVR
jgi:hypothetical protein